MVYRHY